MTEFRILPGLPASGPPAEPFPPAFGRLGREGLVVEVRPPGATPWLGNFRLGLTKFSGIFRHPDGRALFVVAGGHGYVVNAVTRALQSEIGGAIVGVWELGDPPSLLLDHQRISFERIGAGGRLWRSRRLSWDGFQQVAITSDAITGLGWHAPTDTWHRFDVDVRTGRTRQGADIGPELAEGEDLLTSDGSAA